MGKIIMLEGEEDTKGLRLVGFYLLISAADRVEEYAKERHRANTCGVSFW